MEMSDGDQVDERARMIMRRALELPAPSAGEAIDCQLLGQIDEGTLKLDEIDENDLGRLIDSYGIDEVSDAFLTGSEFHQKPATASRLWWARPEIMAIAASFVLLAAGAIVYMRVIERGHAFDVSQLALNWSPGEGLAASDSGAWGSPDSKPASGGPDFNLASRDVDGADPDLIRLREGTAIVRTDVGFGSGALIDPNGYVITNYHVIAAAAQAAAATGKVGVCDVILPHMVEGRLKPTPAVSARIYRVDMEHDLALLKLDSFPAGQANPLPSLSLADAVTDGEACTVIGSEMNGPAWWARKTTLSGRFNFPKDVETTASTAERTRVSLLVSGAVTLPGDSGGPLLDSNGKLIGLTTVNPAGLNGGAVGYHIALENLRTFLKNIPREPEGVPFDFWSAGLPAARMQQPELKHSAGSGYSDMLRIRYLSDSGSARQLLADAIYFDSTGRNTASESEVDSHIPYGLWGTENRGLFQFDLCVLRRSDGLVAVGYVNQSRLLSEIRIATAGMSRADVVWKKLSDGSWHVAQNATGEPLLDLAAVHAANVDRLTAMLKQIFQLEKN